MDSTSILVPSKQLHQLQGIQNAYRVLAKHSFWPGVTRPFVVVGRV